MPSDPEEEEKSYKRMVRIGEISEVPREQRTAEEILELSTLSRDEGEWRMRQDPELTAEVFDMLLGKKNSNSPISTMQTSPQASN